jgi:hypothetical protein
MGDRRHWRNVAWFVLVMGSGAAAWVVLWWVGTRLWGW